MARIIPKEPHNQTSSSAEIRLFNELRNQLSEEYTVFHSVAWQLREYKQNVKDGETDFLIAHPFLGLLIIEVKGGHIEYDSYTDQWLSNNMPISDPFRQGRRAKYSILEKLKENNYWQDRWIDIGYSVAFPDVKIAKDLRLDAPRELILDDTDMSNLSAWIIRAYYFVNGGKINEKASFDDEGLALLERILSPSWDFHPTISSMIMIQKEAIARLTEEQFKIIDFLQHHRRVKIAGCAGSGKTLLALEKAIRLQRDGFRTLLLCHNPYLADYLQQQLQQENVEVLDFSTWINRIIGKTDVINTDWINLQEPTPDELNKAFDILVNCNSRYDAIVVDEGQDFPEEWWILIEGQLVEEAGILYIFYDDNQALTPRQTKYPITDAPFVMSKNCRNTGRIFDLVKMFYPQTVETSILLAKQGIVEGWELRQDQDIYILSKVIRKILDQLNADQVVILTSESELVSLRGLSIKMMPKVRWQDVVLFHLKSLQVFKFDKTYRKYGYPSYDPTDDLPKLSNKNSPTEDDIHHVVEFANSRVHLPKDSLNKLVKFANKGRWVLEHGEYTISGLSKPGDVLSFFLSESWAHGIPKRKKYTLCTLNELPKSRENHVLISSVASYKGLESDGVILFMRSPVDNLATNLYVGISRARHLLYLLIGQEIIADMHHIFKELDVNFRR